MKTNKRFSNIINSDRPVLVDFYTQWCNPCKQIPFLIKEAKEEIKSSIRILKVDVDRNPLIATDFNVLSVPTLIMFRKGLPVWTKVGIPCNVELKEVLKQHSNCGLS